MNEAVAEALRAGQIIQGLRDFVRRGETERRIENVVTMIKEAGTLALTGAGSSGVHVRFDFDPNTMRVLVDRIQIQQVLVNLISNAIEAMAKSARRELIVTTTSIDEETVEIAVADSGPGLPKEIAAHLFKPFVSTKPNGMGLGLSICRSIIESHGGSLGSEPNPGGGMIFRFTLAAVPQPAVPQKE